MKNIFSEGHLPKCVFISGATSGLGLALTELLSKKGVSKFILTGRNEYHLNNIASALKIQHRNVITHTCDLASKEERKSCIHIIEENTPDLTINCAGFGFYNDFSSSNIEEEHAMISLHCNAVVDLTKAAARSLINKNLRGIILNVSSALAFLPTPYFSVYAASKAFINSFSQSIDYELSSNGVRVLVSCPGQIATNFQKRAAHGKDIEEKMVSFFVMKKEKAASLIWKQILQEKRLSIINWKVYILIRLAQILSKNCIMKILENSIKDRF